jgi:hypothetical protein
VKIISAVLLATCCTALPAGAQTRPVVSLAPPDPTVWDAAGYAGARSANNPDLSLGSNQWSNAGAISASIGRLWMGHLKPELDLAATPEARQFVQSTFGTPDGPTFRFGERRFTTASLSGSVLYQFGENAWLHPFLGGGFSVTRDDAHLTLQEQAACVRPPCALTPLAVQDRVSYDLRPFLTGGFKWYVGERAFIRGDVRSAWSSSRAESLVWRVGVGTDF